MVWTGVGTIEYLMIGLCAICLPINLLFLAMLVKFRDRSPLNSSFFHLCLHLTVADTIMMLFSNLAFKFPMYGWFPAQILWENQEGLVPKLPVIGVWYFSHAQAFGIITLALNRFTATWWPLKHREFWWTRSHINVALLLQWVLPIAIITPLFFADFTIDSNNATGGIHFVAESADFHRAYFIFTAVFDGALVNILVTTLYILIFYKIHTHSNAVGSPSMKLQTPKVALRLATSGFLMFLCYLALGVFSILTAMEPATSRWMYRDIWFIANDILCSSNAPIILMLNKPVRDLFWALLGWPDPGRARSDSLARRSIYRHAQMLVSFSPV